MALFDCTDRFERLEVEPTGSVANDRLDRSLTRRSTTTRYDLQME
jgi:hypothetical protein